MDIILSGTLVEVCEYQEDDKYIEYRMFLYNDMKCISTSNLKSLCTQPDDWDHDPEDPFGGSFVNIPSLLRRYGPIYIQGNNILYTQYPISRPPMLMNISIDIAELYQPGEYDRVSCVSHINDIYIIDNDILDPMFMMRLKANGMDIVYSYHISIYTDRVPNDTDNIYKYRISIFMKKIISYTDITIFTGE